MALIQLAKPKKPHLGPRPKPKIEVWVTPRENLVFQTWGKEKGKKSHYLSLSSLVRPQKHIRGKCNNSRKIAVYISFDWAKKVQDFTMFNLGKKVFKKQKPIRQFCQIPCSTSLHLLANLAPAPPPNDHQRVLSPPLFFSEKTLFSKTKIGLDWWVRGRGEKILSKNNIVPRSTCCFCYWGRIGGRWGEIMWKTVWLLLQGIGRKNISPRTETAMLRALHIWEDDFGHRTSGNAGKYCARFSTHA